MPEQSELDQHDADSGAQPEPEYRYRLSPLVLTVFKREIGDGNVVRHCDLQRVYTPDDGETFNHTHSLRPRDLRKAAALLTEAANRLEGFSIQAVGDDPEDD